MSFLDEIPRPELSHNFETTDEALNTIKKAANERINTSSAVENLNVSLTENKEEVYIQDTDEKRDYRKNVIHGTMRTLGDLAATRRSVFGNLAEQPKGLELTPEQAWLAVLLVKTDLYPPTDIF